MISERNKIDELFEGAFGESSPISGESTDWDSMEMKLETSRFYRFKISRFNIYYASLIALSFSFSLLVAVDYFFNKKPISASSVSTIEEQKDKSINNIDNNKSAEQQLLKDKNNSLEKKQPFSKTKENILEVASSSDKKNSGNNITFDTLSNIPLNEIHTEPVNTTQPEVPLPKNQEKKKRIVYVSKRDTIYNYDTLRVEKRKKKKN